MFHPKKTHRLVAVVMTATAFTVGACSSPEFPEDIPRVVFSNLSDGDVVASPVNVCLEATNIAIEASGEIVEGSGHYHVLVDLDDDETSTFTSGGSPIPKDVEPRYVHLGDGSSCKEIPLEPGEHTLMAVIADGGHVTLDPPVNTGVSVVVE